MRASGRRGVHLLCDATLGTGGAPALLCGAKGREVPTLPLIGHFQPCVTEIYLHIDARMAGYIRTHPGRDATNTLRAAFSNSLVRITKTHRCGGRAVEEADLLRGQLAVSTEERGSIEHIW